HDQPELDGQEVGPYHLLDHVTVSGHEVPLPPPDGDEVLQVVNHEGADHIDQRLPYDVVDERLLRKLVDERELVSDEDDLADKESADRGPGERGRLDAVLPEHQRTEQRNDVEGDEEENRWRQDLAQLVLDSFGQATHVDVPLLSMRAAPVHEGE